MKTIRVHDQQVVITDETIKATCQWYADNAQGCIDEVLNGSVKVNDQASYIADCEARKEKYLSGEYEESLAFWQKAYYIQSGESVGLLG